MENITQGIRLLAIAGLGVAVLLGIAVFVRILMQKKDLDRLIFIVLVVCISGYGLLQILLLWRWALALAVVSLVLSIGFVIFSIVKRKPLHILFTLFYTAVWLLLIFFGAAELIS